MTDRKLRLTGSLSPQDLKKIKSAGHLIVFNATEREIFTANDLISDKVAILIVEEYELYDLELALELVHSQFKIKDPSLLIKVKSLYKDVFG